MPPPFRLLTVDEFANEVALHPWARPVFRVDMHHTWYPSHADWRGAGSVEGMWLFHTRDRGFEDIAQHVSIMPDGGIWTGRDWNKTPASVGFGLNAGVFMLEMVGNFDVGHDTLGTAQLEATLHVVRTVQCRFALPVEACLFHREVPVTEKTCPGTGLDKAEFLAALWRVEGHGARAIA